MEREITLEKHTTKSWLKSAILGLLIGLAVIVPGVSGAHISIIFKLYDKITYSISNIFKKFKICFMFLLPIILGAAIGFVLGFFAIKELVAIATFITVALFAGMMLGGTPVIYQEIKNSKRNVIKILLLIIGLILPIGISVIAVNVNFNLQTALDSMEWWMYIIALPIGFIVAVTQLIPGLSATSTLMSIGLFTPLMESVSLTYWKSNPMVLVFYILMIVGFVLGLFLLSKLITKTIEKYKSYFYTLALGLTFSSIVAMFYNPEVVSCYNAWSINFDSNAVIQLSVGIPLFFVGFAGIFAFTLYVNKKTKKEENN